ncbi:MAG: hypothetical protein P8X74_07940 [Reinekea sp.]
MGALRVFEKQIETKLLHPTSTEQIADSGYSFDFLKAQYFFQNNALDNRFNMLL